MEMEKVKELIGQSMKLGVFMEKVGEDVNNIEYGGRLLEESYEQKWFITLFGKGEHITVYYKHTNSLETYLDIIRRGNIEDLYIKIVKAELVKLENGDVKYYAL